MCEWLALDPILTLRLLDATADASADLRVGVAGLSLAKRAAAIGPELVKSLLMSAARSSLGAEPASLSARELGEFWIHALRVAFLARSLAEVCSYRSPDEAYVTGLLHDLGSFALLATVPNTLRALVATQANAPWGAVPEHAGRLGTIHAQIGAALLEKLQGPFYVADAGLLDHAPPEQLEARFDALAQRFARGHIAEPDDQLSTPAGVLRAADQALYRAKQGGRNRVSS